MKTLEELMNIDYEERLRLYSEDRVIAKKMMIFDMIINKKIGKRIPIKESGAGVSRIWNFFDSGKVFIQLTGFKGCQLDRKENLRRNSEMLSVLISHGVGVVNVIGNDYCKDLEDGTPDPNSIVEEPGFFVSYSTDNKNCKIRNNNDLKQLGMKLCKQFDQWGYLYGDKKTVESIDCNGNVTKRLNRISFNIDKLNMMWTKIKGRKYTFTESVHREGPIQGLMWQDFINEISLNIKSVK